MTTVELNRYRYNDPKEFYGDILNSKDQNILVTWLQVELQVDNLVFYNLMGHTQHQTGSKWMTEYKCRSKIFINKSF